MRFPMMILGALLAVTLSGCGLTQNYDQGIDAKTQAYNRSQKILDEQNQIELNNLQAKQREQDIQKSKAEGQMEQAKAAGSAQAAIEAARGEAQSILIKAQAEAQGNRAIAQSLTPAMVQYHMIDALSDKSIIYLPSGVLPYMNVVTPGGLPSQGAR